MPLVVSFTEVTCSVKAKDAALASAAHGSLKMNTPVSLRMGPGEGEGREKIGQCSKPIGVIMVQVAALIN